MPKYLTFNTSLEGHSTKADVNPTVDVSIDPPLRYQWVLWEQIIMDSNNKGANYSDATHKVGKIKTVKEFWRYWNHLPQPSELLQNKKFIREGPDGVQNVVDALMIFKEGIKPEWEDKINTHGGHFPFSLKPTIGGGQVDEYWNNVVLGMVGSTIEPAYMITGIRLVDKLAAQRNPGVRIEVWFSDYHDTANVDLLQKNVEKCMCTKLDGTLGPPNWGKTGERKSHQSGKK